MNNPFRNSRLTGTTSTGGETSVQSSGAAHPLVTRDTPPRPPDPIVTLPLPLVSLESCRGAFKTLHKGETPKRAIFKDHRAKYQNRTYLTNLADVTEEVSQTSTSSKDKDGRLSSPRADGPSNWSPSKPEDLQGPLAKYRTK